MILGFYKVKLSNETMWLFLGFTIINVSRITTFQFTADGTTDLHDGGTRKGTVQDSAVPQSASGSLI